MKSVGTSRLLLIGGGGHCRSVIDSVLRSGEYTDLGIVDHTDNAILGIPVVGTDDDLPRLMKEGWDSAFITVGSVGDASLRKRLFNMVKDLGFIIPIIKDPSAVVSDDVEIGEGSFIGKKTVVNSGATIGFCSILNTGSIIEHDCSVGDFSHISPGAVLCGMVKVGAGSHIGAGSVVIQQINVGDGVLIGAGSVVVRDVPAGSKAFGNPCKVRI